MFKALNDFTQAYLSDLMKWYSPPWAHCLAEAVNLRYQSQPMNSGITLGFVPLWGFLKMRKSISNRNMKWGTYCRHCRWSSCHGRGYPWPGMLDWLQTQLYCISHNCLEKKSHKTTISVLPLLLHAVTDTVASVAPLWVMGSIPHRHHSKQASLSWCRFSVHWWCVTGCVHLTPGSQMLPLSPHSSSHNYSALQLFLKHSQYISTH